MIKFTGWEKGVYGTFQLESMQLQPGIWAERILIAHEGNWIDSSVMMAYREYANYEDVQQDLGDGLRFVGKEYSKLFNRSLFLYEIARPAKGLGYKIAVPATGEEFCFEIYGVDSKGIQYLMLHREL